MVYEREATDRDLKRMELDPQDYMPYTGSDNAHGRTSNKPLKWTDLS